MTLLAEVVATSAAVTATSARRAKTDALAALLRRLEPGEIEPAVAWLSGETRQGRLNVGWSTLRDVDGGNAQVAELDVASVDAALDRLAAVQGAGSLAERRRILAGVMGRATPTEAEFLRQLLLGGLRQGALAGVMADAVAAAAGVPAAAVRRAAMLAGDLPTAARVAITQGRPGLDAVTMRVGRPVQPMLASTSPDVGSAVGSMAGPASVEWKLDGVRVQLHKDGDEVSVFSRNLLDVTERLPDLVAVGRALPARQVVLDGEVIGLGPELADAVEETGAGGGGSGGRPDLFQRTASAFAAQQRADAAPALQPFFFDVLHVDGQDTIDLPLLERLTVLSAVAGPRRIPGIVTEDPEEAGRFAQEAIAAGHEGVMVKAGRSLYEAGRRGKAWRKVKPVHTLDLVVLGAEWGHGRRRGWLSNLHLGARDPESPGRFVMVGKTFKGLTDELLEWQTAAFLARKVGEEGITVFVRPELVAEIALDGVQISSRYEGGVALRFARVRRYRPDKSPEEADTIDAVRAMLPGGLEPPAGR